MNSIRRPAAALAALTCMAALPAAANATAPATSVPAPPATAPAPPAAAVAGKVKLVLQKLGGKPHFAITSAPIVVRGVVIPYVAGQTMKVSFYRDGRKIGVKQVSVLALGNGAGQFHCTSRALRPAWCRFAPPTMRQASSLPSAVARRACGWPTRSRPGLLGPVGTADAVGAEPAALRRAAVGGLRRSDRKGADGLPQDDRPEPGAGRGQAGLQADVERGRQLPGALPPRRPPRRGRPDQAGAGGDRTRRACEGDSTR